MTTAAGRRSEGVATIVLPLSVIICTRDRAELLTEAVASILCGDHIPAELLIVDQSDRRDMRWLEVQTPPGCVVRYAQIAARGLSYARNRAMRMAAHPLLVWTDDDVSVGAGWLRRICDALRTAGPGTVVTGRVLAGAGRPDGFVPTLKGGPDRALHSEIIRFDPLVTFNMAAHRSDLERVGGFDERLGPGTRFHAGEDNELAFRLLSVGVRIAYEPDVIVYHRAWRAASEFVRLRWRYGLGQGGFLARHLWARGGYGARRLAGTIAALMRRAPRRLWTADHSGNLSRWTLMKGDYALVAGLITGALVWPLRSRPADPASRQ